MVVPSVRVHIARGFNILCDFVENILQGTDRRGTMHSFVSES